MNPRLVAAGVAGLCVVVVSTGCTDVGAAPHDSRAKAPASTAPPTPLTEREPRVVTLAFAGDTHFQLNLASLLDHPRGALGPIEDTLADADLTMLNLESAITQGGSWDPKELEDPADRFWYRASPRALGLLAGAGVDVVTVANNHGADYGPEGLADTLRAVERGPIPVVGVGRDRTAAFTPYRVTIDDTHIAFLAADASTREGRSPDWEAGPSSPGIAAARGSHTHTLLAAVRMAAAHDEVVVVYLHWGVEGHACPSRSQRNLAGALAGAGADVVVGSHTHVQQGAGWLGDTYVDYGLGNFLWYHNGVPDSGVLRVRVEDGHVVSDRWVPARIPVDRSAGPRARSRAGRGGRPLAVTARLLGSCVPASIVGPPARVAPDVLFLRPSYRLGAAGQNGCDPRARVPRAVVRPPVTAFVLHRLRRCSPHRPDRCGRAARARRGRSVRSPVPRSLADPASAARQRLRWGRRAVDGGRQQLGVQLPSRRWERPLVSARLRRRDRHQPGREPGSARWFSASCRGPSFRAPRPDGMRSGASRRHPSRRRGCQSLRGDRLGVGCDMVVSGLPALLHGSRPADDQVHEGDGSGNRSRSSRIVTV